jgi:PncC family amidohydrolase
LRRRRTRSGPSGRRATAIGAPRDLVSIARDLQATCLRGALTVAVAESCTGGLLAAAITDVAGASAYFLGGVVSYSNAAKSALLDVPAALLDRHGAVSDEVAAAMASGARTRFQAELAVSVTGIAGPDGGTAEKPVGLVYLGLASSAGVATVREHFAGDRAAVRRSAAARSLELLLEHARPLAT